MLVSDLDLRVASGDPPLIWINSTSIAVLAWDANAEKSGDLYFRILRGRNVVDQWKNSFNTKLPAVSVLQSGGVRVPTSPTGRLIRIDLPANKRTTLRQGAIHRLQISSDRRTLTFLQEDPGIPGKAVAFFFEKATDPDKMYDAVNWGTTQHAIDAFSGDEVALSPAAPVEIRPPLPKTGTAETLPRPDAHRLSASRNGTATLFVANATDGSTMWLCNGSASAEQRCSEVWRANEWVREIKTGRAEPISYTSTEGKRLTAWTLLPPDYSPGRRLPVVTMVYPGTTYGSSTPSDFSLYQSNFEHPQLFAALGYLVLLPSMPLPKDASGLVP